MSTATLANPRSPALPLIACTLAGALIGAATLLLHGSPSAVVQQATNSTSAWIIWPAVAGALIPRRTVAMLAGALMMLAALAAYYAVAAAQNLFSLSALGTAGVWGIAGIIGGPILAWSAWNTRHATAFPRNLGAALVAAVVAGEGLWLGLILGYWPTALVFLITATLLVIGLTSYRYRTAGPHSWTPLLFFPVLAFAYLAAEYFALNTLLAAV